MLWLEYVLLKSMLETETLVQQCWGVGVEISGKHLGQKCSTPMDVYSRYEMKG